MKKCKSCQMEIDNKAKKCPHCQADQRSWFGKHPIMTVILVLFIVFLGSSLSKTSKTAPSKSSEGKVISSSTEEAVQPTPTEAPIKITAKQLADDFDANQVAAEANWNGKLVEFSAEISNITDYGISFYRVASKEFSLAQISCRIKDKSQLLTLKNGQTVTVRGVVGKQTLGVIDVKDCEVVK